MLCYGNTNDGEQVSPNERQEAIWHVLCVRRRDTAENLAHEFDVTIRTIYRDIQMLTLTYPIESIRGRHGGGYQLAAWFHPNRTTLCPEQLALLLRLAPTLQGDDLRVLRSILTQFSP